MAEFRFPHSSLPFDEFIRYLNGGEYLNTFEVGSVTIPETTWPTKSRIAEKRDLVVEQILNRSWINPEKFDETCRKKDLGSLGEKEHVQLGFKHPENLEKKQVSNLRKLIEEAKNVKKEKAGPKLLSDDDNIEVGRILEEMSGPDQLLMLDNLDNSCNIYEKKTSPIQTISKKDDISCCSDGVKRVSSTTNKKKVPSVSSFLDCDKELKLEGSKRKLKKSYDEIENEKKKRRIQVIDYHKPLEIKQPPRPKKAPVKKKNNLINKLRRSQVCIREMKLDSAIFV